MAPSTQLHKIVKQWASLRGMGVLSADPRLDRVARANSEALAELQGARPSGATTFLQHLLEQEQVTDAVVHGLVLEPGQGQLPNRLAQALSRSATGRFTHCGVGQAGGVVTVILARRLVDIRVSRQEGRIQLCLDPCRPLRKPSLLVTFPNGGMFERHWDGRPRCFRLPTRLRGRLQVEVMVEGRYGPEVAALFPLYVGVARPALPSHKLYPDEGQEHVEIRLMRMVNRTRREKGLASLRPSRVLAGVARRHSQDMLTSGYFGHVSPTRGDLARRLSLAGIPYDGAGENLALATSPRKAHERLMASPSHRRTLLDPDATHIGVGVAKDSGRGLLYVTQILATY